MDNGFDGVHENVGEPDYNVDEMNDLKNVMDDAEVATRPSLVEGEKEASSDSVSDTETWGLLDLLKDIHKPTVRPNDQSYQPYGAFHFRQPGKARVKEMMGDELCIIDIDNRPFDEDGQAFGRSMSWDHPETLHGISLGLLNHWLYGTCC